MSQPGGGAAGALQALCADNGPAGRANNALMAVSAAVLTAPGFPPTAKLVFIGIVITLEFIKWWIGQKRKRIAQCRLIEGIPEEGGVAYKQIVERYTHQPYTFRYSPPRDTITAIAIIPVDEETQSPEAEVVEGGINHNFAVIRLTPVEKGPWGSDITICTKPSSATPALEAVSTSAAAAAAHNACSAASPAETNHAAGPAPTPTVLADAAAATPATISHWLVPVLLLMFFIIIIIMIMMIVIIVRA